MATSVDFSSDETAWGAVYAGEDFYFTWPEFNGVLLSVTASEEFPGVFYDTIGIRGVFPLNLFNPCVIITNYSKVICEIISDPNLFFDFNYDCIYSTGQIIRHVVTVYQDHDISSSILISELNKERIDYAKRNP